MGTNVAVGDGSLFSGLDWFTIPCRFFLFSLFLFFFFFFGDRSFIFTIEVFKARYHPTIRFIR